MAKDRVTRSKPPALTRDTYDDPSAVLYDGKHDKKYSSLYEAAVTQITSDETSRKFLTKTHSSLDLFDVRYVFCSCTIRSSLTSYSASLLSTDSEAGSSIRLTVVTTNNEGTEKLSQYDFNCQALIRFTNRLAWIPEIFTLKGIKIMPERVLSLDIIQRDVDNFCAQEENQEFARSIMKIYKMWVDFCIFDSLLGSGAEKGHHFKLQLACVRFGGMLEDRDFEQLALREIRMVWIEDNDGSKMPSADDFRLAFALSPALDEFLLGVYDTATALVPQSEVVRRFKEIYHKMQTILPKSWETITGVHTTAQKGKQVPGKKAAHVLSGTDRAECKDTSRHTETASATGRKLSVDATATGAGAAAQAPRALKSILKASSINGGLREAAEMSTRQSISQEPYYDNGIHYLIAGMRVEIKDGKRQGQQGNVCRVNHGKKTIEVYSKIRR